MVGALGAWTSHEVTNLELGTTCQAPYLLEEATTPTDLPGMLHSAPFNPVGVLHTDSPLLDRKEPCGGMLMSHGLEPWCMVL